jgi:hypothetical protein
MAAVQANPMLSSKKDHRSQGKLRSSNATYLASSGTTGANGHLDLFGTNGGTISHNTTLD